MSEEVQAFNSFPKIFDGAREVIDKEKVKDQFFRSPALSWADFCTEYNYNAKNRAAFPVRSWTEEKLQLRVEYGDEALLQKQLEARHLILENRINFPKQWNDEARKSLVYCNIIENGWIRDAQWNQQNTQAIAQNPSLARPLADIREVNVLVRTKREIQAMQREALLLKALEMQEIAPIKAADPEVIQAEAEENRLKEIGYARLGGGAIDHESLTQLYKNWFDQEKNSQTSEPEPSDNPLLPLTPLEDE